MISQSLYRVLCELSDICHPVATIKRVIKKVGNSMTREELEQFTRPYVLVIHQPTRRGFYLNREYRHIIDVSCCQEPEKPVEVKRHHLCASSNHPAWAQNEYKDSREFDTFWLY